MLNKLTRMKRLRLILSVAVAAMLQVHASAQSCSIDWDVSLYGTGATGKTLPFWAVTNKTGMIPDAHSAILEADAGFSYSSGKTDLDLWSGFRLSGNMHPSAAPVCRGMVNELYAGIGWKKLRLDLGMIDRECLYDGLSLTGGDIIWSGNARALPGYNLQIEYFAVPGTKGIFSIKANYADYRFIGERYVRNAYLHNKSLFFKFRLHPRVHLQLGLEQWSVWGGVSPVNGRQPQSFKDYLRVVCGLSGGSDATESDQINVLGDHRGRELIQIDWTADAFTMSFAHDIPFDDGSGMGFQNFPDGVNTISFSFNGKDKWVSDILYEFVYTKCQSGPYHDTGDDPSRQDEEWHVLGGNDNYFNNGEYRSGWTSYGKTIGLPLFTPMPADGNGLVLGVCNNRVSAHHIGLAGKLARKIPYRFKATYSRNYGRYSQQGLYAEFFGTVPEQLSMALEVDFPIFSKRFPIALSTGIYVDAGELYGDNFGITLKLSYTGKYFSGDNR